MQVGLEGSLHLPSLELPSVCSIVLKWWGPHGIDYARRRAMSP